MKSILLGALRAYRFFLSPWVGNQCLYWPTCSEYARQAVERHGAWRGTVMAVARVLRCRPGTPGGIDPVPESFSYRCLCGGAHAASCAAPVIEPGSR